MPEICCEFLDVPRFQLEAGFVFSLLEEYPHTILKLTWGFGTDPESPEFGEPRNVSAAEIRRIFDDAVAKGMYTWGWADAFISLAEDDPTITFCHETDIHVKSKQEYWLRRFTDRWFAVGIAWFRKETEDGEWSEFPKVQ